MNSLKKLAAAAAISVAQADEALKIIENGHVKQVWLLAGDKQMNSEDTGFTLPHNSHTMVGVRDGHGGFAADIYYTPNLFGGAIEYDIDLSQAGCGCDVAAYIIRMPAHNADGSLRPGNDGSYYCDAMASRGAFCPDIDLMEANKYAFDMTLHKCDEPNAEKHYFNCDQSLSCGSAIHSGPPKHPYDTDEYRYGPGNIYAINTLKPFHVRIDFKNQDDKLDAVELTLSQPGHGKVTTYTMADRGCAAGYLDDMKDSLQNGMALNISSWGVGDGSSVLDWLDKDTGCTGGCNNDPKVAFSNI